MSRKTFADVESAVELAIETSKIIKFKILDEVGNLESQGEACQCGCIYFNTVLSDGTIGWGEWAEECPVHAWEESHPDEDWFDIDNQSEWPEDMPF